MLVVTLACSLPAAALAGGLEVGDTGAEALGRGGAFTAKADNAASINYNPAGFVKLRGHHLTVGGNVVLSRYDFTRTGYMTLGNTADSVAFPTVSSSTPVFAAPRHLMFTTDFGYFDRVTVAAGMYVPSAAGGAYPTEIEVNGRKVAAPQRFSQVETSGLIFFPSLAVAFRPAPWLDIGVTFQTVVTSIKTTNIVTAATACDQPEDPNCDITLNIEASKLLTPTGSAGVLLRPSRNLEFGAMVRLPSSATLEGKADITLGPALKKLEGSMTKKMVSPLDPEVTLNNDYPWMVRTGARVIFREGDEEVGDLELDFIYERWSAVSERTVEVKGTSLGKPMEPTVMDWGLKDTYGVRLGSSYRLRLSSSVDLTLRGGAFYESASTEISNTSLSIIGARRLGVTGGLGLRWGRLRLDLAYAHLFFPDRVVNRSTVRAQDFGGNGPGPVVGNGTYSASMDMFSMQLSVAFGRGVPGYQPRRVPRLPHDPGFDPRRDGRWAKAVQPAEDPNVPSYHGGVKRYAGSTSRIKRFRSAARSTKRYRASSRRSIKRYRGRSPRRVKRHRPAQASSEPLYQAEVLTEQSSDYQFEPVTVSR